MKKKIIWEKWVDPLDQINDEENDGSKPYPVQFTPHGVIALKIHAPVNNNLVFWVGHTNFDISREVYNKILQINGVNIFNVFSPYMFRVSIGLAFDAETVKRNIVKELCYNPNGFVIPKEKKLQIEHARLDLMASNNAWAIYVLPNGEFSQISSNDKRFNEIVSSFRLAKKELGGKLLMGYK